MVAYLLFYTFLVKTASPQDYENVFNIFIIQIVLGFIAIIFSSFLVWILQKKVKNIRTIFHIPLIILFIWGNLLGWLSTLGFLVGYCLMENDLYKKYKDSLSNMSKKDKEKYQKKFLIAMIVGGIISLIIIWFFFFPNILNDVDDRAQLLQEEVEKCYLTEDLSNLLDERNVCMINVAITFEGGRGYCDKLSNVYETNLCYIGMLSHSDNYESCKKYLKEDPDNVLSPQEYEDLCNFSYTIAREKDVCDLINDQKLKETCNLKVNELF